MPASLRSAARAAGMAASGRRSRAAILRAARSRAASRAQANCRRESADAFAPTLALAQRHNTGSPAAKGTTRSASTQPTTPRPTKSTTTPRLVGVPRRGTLPEISSRGRFDTSEEPNLTIRAGHHGYSSNFAHATSPTRATVKPCCGAILGASSSSVGEHLGHGHSVSVGTASSGGSRHARWNQRPHPASHSMSESSSSPRRHTSHTTEAHASS
mmetsp:Transcript_20814/g.82984  ORF Transcript_20814/g.82984 Transcript_20814/m.82984 type:complete len:214 (-) Transcript_20814:36-677(-)